MRSQQLRYLPPALWGSGQTWCCCCLPALRDIKLEFRYFQRWNASFVQSIVSEQLKITVKGCPRTRCPRTSLLLPLRAEDGKTQYLCWPRFLAPRDQGSIPGELLTQRKTSCPMSIRYCSAASEAVCLNLGRVKNPRARELSNYITRYPKSQKRLGLKRLKFRSSSGEFS